MELANWADNELIMKSLILIVHLSSLESQALKSQRQSSMADANGMGMTNSHVQGCNAICNGCTITTGRMDVDRGWITCI